MTTPPALRDHLRRLLDWEDAHAGFDAAVDDLLEAFRGIRPEGTPHSPWELVEHMRRTQHDLLDFCRNPEYHELNWPDDYWPAEPAPTSAKEWNESIASFRKDRDALKELAADSSIDLLSAIPHGTGQTYLRELLLVADHTSYHLGQLIAARRQLGAW